MNKTIKLTQPSINDHKLIYDLLMDGVSGNVYDKVLIENLDYFNFMCENMALNPCSIDLGSGRSIENFMCSLDDENIGFITIAYDMRKNEVEIWYFSIEKKYQNQGYGKIYFKLALDIITAAAQNTWERCSNRISKNNFYLHNRTLYYRFCL